MPSKLPSFTQSLKVIILDPFGPSFLGSVGVPLLEAGAVCASKLLPLLELEEEGFGFGNSAFQSPVKFGFIVADVPLELVLVELAPLEVTTHSPLTFPQVTVESNIPVQDGLKQAPIMKPGVSGAHTVEQEQFENMGIQLNSEFEEPELVDVELPEDELVVLPELVDVELPEDELVVLPELEVEEPELDDVELPLELELLVELV